jgi:hypothetical protein
VAERPTEDSADPLVILGNLPPLRTFPTGDPYVRRVEFGDLGLIAYLVNDATEIVIILDITWVGQSPPRCGDPHR